MSILHDIESGDLHPMKDYTIYDYIADYQQRECDQQVYTLAEETGLDREALKTLVGKDVNSQNINEHGRFDNLIASVDKNLATAFLKKVMGRDIRSRFIVSNISSLVRRFVLSPADREK